MRPHLKSVVLRISTHTRRRACWERRVLGGYVKSAVNADYPLGFGYLLIGSESLPRAMSWSVDVGWREGILDRDQRHSTCTRR
jgi:hypothetical protein